MSDKDFKLKSSSEGFDTRTKDIFANIDSLASNSKKQQNSEEQKQPRKRITAPSPPPEDNCRDSDKKRTEEFKNCESIFRTPNESGWPPTRSRHDRKRPHHGNRNQRGSRRTPDHVVNPNKYKKYDLSDVSKDQLSDRSNSRAAFDFLRQLKERKKEEDDSNSDQDEQDFETRKVSFKKPFNFKKPSTPGSPKAESTSSAAVQDGNKRIMPECVVGQKSKPKSIVKSDDSSKTSEKSKIKKSSKTICLSHLDEEEEDDSD